MEFSAQAESFVGSLTDGTFTMCARIDNVVQLAGSGAMIEDEIYGVIGRRLRARRRLLGMTQRMVGLHCGLTFQQIQKYEAGSTAMPVARLIALAEALRAPVTDFIVGVQESRSPPPAADGVEAAA
jgi:DNA-binding XRE family transcriptional regulator